MVFRLHVRTLKLPDLFLTTPKKYENIKPEEFVTEMYIF